MFHLSHNNRTGMFDFPAPSERPLQVCELFQQVLDGLVVDKDRALAEVSADYSATTERRQEASMISTPSSARNMQSSSHTDMDRLSSKRGFVDFDLLCLGADFAILLRCREVIGR